MDGILPSAPRLEQIAEGFTFTEGPAGRTLYLTARTGLYRLRLGVEGPAPLNDGTPVARPAGLAAETGGS